MLRVTLAPYRETLQRISGIVLTINSPMQEIKHAFRIATLRTHPDKTDSDGTEFIEVQQAFDYLTGRQAPKDAQDLLQERVACDQTQLAIMPLHTSTDKLKMDFYVGLLQILEDPEAELYSNSLNFRAPDETKYWFNTASKFCDARFGIRKDNLPGAPLTLAEIKKIQPPVKKVRPLVGYNYYKAGGDVTKFLEYDRDEVGNCFAASRDDATRLSSRGWKALCYCIGHPLDTTILQPYLEAFQNLSKRERDAPMEGQLTPTFKMQKTFDRYKMRMMEESTVYVPEHNGEAS